MKKILIIHNIFWSHYKAIIFSELNTQIKKKGNELLVVHIALKGIAQNNLGLPDVNLHNYPFKVLFSEDYEVPNIFRKCIAVWREILLFKPDVVVLPGFGEFSFWIMLVATKFLGSPAILTCDSTAMDRPASWYKNFLKRIFVRSCDAAFSYGTKSAEYLVSLGMSRDAIFSRCQAIDNTKFEKICSDAHANRTKSIVSLGLKNRNFIYVGRLNKIKNIEILINSFKFLKFSEPLALDWGLIIVGDGPERENLKALSEPLQNLDINFTGGKEWHDIPRFYALADVFVLPSLSEPWGLVVNEAMACGLPVVVSNRCGSAYDLVDSGKNGFVFDPINEESLLDCLRYFIYNPDKIASMGDCSRYMLKDYTAEKAASQMSMAFEYIFKKK